MLDIILQWVYLEWVRYTLWVYLEMLSTFPVVEVLVSVYSYMQVEHLSCTVGILQWVYLGWVS